MSATMEPCIQYAKTSDGGEHRLCGVRGFLFADRGEFVAKGFEEPCGCTR